MTIFMIILFFYILNRIDQNSSCKLCNSYYSVIKGLNVFLVGSNWSYCVIFHSE